MFKIDPRSAEAPAKGPAQTNKTLSKFQVLSTAILAAVLSAGTPGSATAQALTTWYQDADGDTYGNPSSSVDADVAPDGYVAVAGDCDDSNSAVNPDALDVADGVDNDCDGEADNDPAFWTDWYQDQDGDGYGNPDVILAAPVQPADYVTDNSDCDDTNGDVNPDATEVEDGVDNDCNGIIDDGDGFAEFRSLDLTLVVTPSEVNSGETVTLQSQLTVRNNGNTTITASSITAGASLGFGSGGNFAPTSFSSDCLVVVELASGESYSCSSSREGTATGAGTFNVNASAIDADDTSGEFGYGLYTVSEAVTVIPTDSTPPTPVVSTTASDPTATSPIPVSVDFGEEVENFVSGDVSVTNGSVSGFVTSDNTTFTFNVTPSAAGAVSVSVAAGVAADLAGNDNTVSNTLDIDYDPDAPTVEISSDASDPTAISPIPVTVTFSEEVEDFVEGDLSVSGGAVSGFATDDNTVFTFDVTPDADGTITVDIAASVATDLAGNDNAAATQFSIEYDSTPPGLVISGVPDSYLPGETFEVTFTFAEDVSGFEASDIEVTGGSLGPLSGGPRIYDATLTPGDTSDVSISVPEGAAEDAAGNPSAAASAGSAIDSAAVAGEMIADFMQARALNLVQSQPGLSRFLNGRSGGNFDVAATSTKGDLSFASGAGSPVWFALDASLTDLSDSAEARYVLATIGGHMSLSDGLLLGGMLQFDDAELDMPGVVGDTSGQGWLAGPYVVARLGDQPLYFEGRLLWGESDNKVNPLGTFTDSFETERFLGLAALEGRYEADEVTMFPRFELSRVEDRQKAYVDGLSNTVPQQTIRQTDVSLGLDFEMPLTGAQDTQFVTWGLSGIWSNVEGSGAASAFIDESDTARGRVDLGYVYRNDAGFEASADAFIDGLGADAFTTYGVALNLRLKF